MFPVELDYEVCHKGRCLKTTHHGIPADENSGEITRFHIDLGRRRCRLKRVLEESKSTVWLMEVLALKGREDVLKLISGPSHRVGRVQI